MAIGTIDYDNKNIRTWLSTQVNTLNTLTLNLKKILKHLQFFLVISASLRFCLLKNLRTVKYNIFFNKCYFRQSVVQKSHSLQWNTHYQYKWKKYKTITKLKQLKNGSNNIKKFKWPVTLTWNKTRQMAHDVIVILLGTVKSKIISRLPTKSVHFF